VRLSRNRHDGDDGGRDGDDGRGDNDGGRDR